MAYYLEMDGVDDYANVPYKAALNATVFSIHAKVTPEVMTNYGAVISSRTGGAVNGYILYRTSANQWQFWVGHGTWKQVGNYTVTAGQTYDLVCVYDGTTAYLYVNGTLNQSIATSINPNNTFPFRIGAVSDASPSFFFKGKIHNIRYWDVALTANDAKSLNNGTRPLANPVAHYDMSTGTVLDQSGNGNHATLTGGTWIEEAPVGIDVSYVYATKQAITKNVTYDYATLQNIKAVPSSGRYIQMDGIDDFLQIPYHVAASAIELDVWITQEHDGVPRYIFDARYGDWIYAMLSYTGHYDVTNAMMYIDDEEVESPYSTPVDTSRRMRIRFTINGGYVEDDLTFFASNEGYQGQNLAVNVYGIKLFYFDDEPIAHFDFTTGTLDDQTGNGYIIELNGGTWVGDDPGPEEVTTVFSTKQSLFANPVTNFPSRQSLYANRSVDNSLKQSMFANRIGQHAIKQTIYAARTVDSSSRQTIYAMRSTAYATKQTLFSDFILYSADFPLKLVFSKTDAQSFPVKVVLTSERTASFALLLRHTANRTNAFAIKQRIYRDASQLYLTQQIVYANRVDTHALKILMIDGDKLIIGTIYLNGSRELNVNLVGSRVLDVILRGEI